MFEWSKHSVCYAEGPEGTYVLLAIRPQRKKDIGQNTETVFWDDGSHERAFPLGKVLKDNPTAFEFEDDRGRRFSLRPLTPELYEQKVRYGTGGPELKTNKDIQDFYLASRSW